MLCSITISLFAHQSTRFVVSGHNMMLVDPDTHQELPLACSKAVVTAHNGVLFVNKRKLRLPLLIIKTSKGPLKCNNKTMPGSIIISYMRDGSCSCTPYTPQKAKQKAQACVVKVLLDEKSIKDHGVWKLESKKRLAVTNVKTQEKKLIHEGGVLVECKHGALYINKKRCADSGCLVTSPDNHISINGTVYHGTLRVILHQGKYMIINHVPLEEYLFSVLNTESWPGWPLEVNKAFAITSRSYVIAMIVGSKKSNKPYHVKNTNLHQTYKGVHTQKVLKDAVDQTKGVFLAYNDEPITAMFDSCCGSVIPAYVQGFDFKKAPYLARQYACKFCKNCKIFNWQAEYDLNTFSQLVSKVYKDIGRVKGLRMVKRDKAGLVLEVHVNGTKKTAGLRAKDLYSCLKDVKSFCFDVQCKSNKIILKGKGYGHHIGLCQWGAREMVRHGWDYKSILQFYYPGTSFMRLS